MRLSDFIEDIKLEYSNNFEFSNMATVDTKVKKTLTYAVESQFAKQADNNDNIVGIIIPKSLSGWKSQKNLVFSEAPISDFYKIFLLWVEKNKSIEVSHISQTAKIHPSASIEKVGVYIGDNVVIEENVIIKEGVTINDNSIVRSNSVIGNEGFDVKKIDGKSIVVPHNGKVIIGKNVEIQSLCNIDKGIMGRDTIIGDYTKIDSMVHIAHCVHLGKNCVIVANVMVSGSCTIGDDVRIGPSSTISNGIKIANGAKISIGSTVISDVKEGQTVTGYFAKKHSHFLFEQILLNKLRKKNER
ncbi:MAG: UDP-3-O-(3-hydroxymyristoyl)glucosamine N-acyltransferase [Pseudomonadota bacterium]